MRSPDRAKSVPTADLSKVVHDSIALEVSRRLLNLMLSGDVPVGSRLPSERELAAQLGVGRNAIRDGLRPLALLGIVEPRPGSGTYVKSTTSDLLPEIVEWGLLLDKPSLLELVEARLYIEIGLSRLAAQRRTAKSVQALRSILARMADAKTSDEFLKADLAFHLRIAEAAENEPLAGMLRHIRTLTAVWSGLVLTERHPDEYYVDHKAVFKAIEARDADTAGAAMERHLSKVIQRIKVALEAQRQGELAVRHF